MPTAWVQGSPLTGEVYELIDYPAKVSFNYDVDINVPFLDHLPTSIINILCSKCGQKNFWTTYTRDRNVWGDRPFYLVKQPQEKWACDFRDDVPPLSFQLQVAEVIF